MQIIKSRACISVLRMAMFSVLAMAGLIVAPAAQAQMKPAQRSEIEAIIKDYLLNNPDVLRDALVEMEKRGKAEEASQRQKAVADLSPKLFDSIHQVVLGNPKGKIQLVEFFDYNCGYCKKAMTDMMAILEKNSDVKVVLKEFPVLGPSSVEAAQVASALRQQFDGEKYLAFHQRLLQARGQVGKVQAMAAAKASGADMDKLEAALKSPAVSAGLQEVMQIADTLSLTGTPSYIVGDEVVIGAVGLPNLQAKIDNLRKCGKTACG